MLADYGIYKQISTLHACFGVNRPRRSRDYNQNGKSEGVLLPAVRANENLYC